MENHKTLSSNTNYIEFISDLKNRISNARLKAHFAVNKELVLLYWHIGNQILQRQSKEGWGGKVIGQISKDLSNAFPETKGFGTQNLKYMKRFAQEYAIKEISQQAVDQIPWGHNIILMYKVKNKQERFFYIKESIKNGWSRNVLSIQIKRGLYSSKDKAISNFNLKLPSPQSDLAQYILKDPYNFDFLALSDEAKEKDIEAGLTKHIEKFLIELGKGFAFVGRQYHIEVGEQDFYIDLIFYHLELRSFVVIEIKNGPFKPEYAGKLNFYLSAIDDIMKKDTDNPSIGLILCKTKNNILAEYALKDMSKPIGLSEYNLAKYLPDNIQSSLPTIEELKFELAKKIKKGP